MKKGLFFLFYVLLLISLVSAIRINEVEMNPADDCRDCTEWAEIYSENEINLSEYYLENNKSQRINLSGIEEGYIKIEFGKRFLTNSGDRLILKKLGEVIDKTPILKDEDNNDKTWQLCNNEWVFSESTKGSKNNCETTTIENITEEEPIQETDNTLLDNTSASETEAGATEISREETPKVKNINITAQVIKLNANPKNIKSENSKELSKSKLAIYGFVTFCILLIALFMLKRERYKKNEFK